MRIVETFKNPPIDKRILAFDVNNPNSVDDIVLSFSKGRENGPIIERIGNDSPRMNAIDGSGYTTDPELQRLGSYFITSSAKEKNITGILLHIIFFWNQLHKLSQERSWGSYFSGAYAEYLLQFFVSKKKMLNVFRLLDVQYLEPKKLLYVEIENLLLAKDEILASIKTKHKKELEKMLTPEALKLEKKVKLAASGQKTIFSDNHELLQAEIEKWIKLFNLNMETHVHLSSFEEKYPNKKVKAFQGCGDLSMNLWNVAVLRNYEGDLDFVFPYDEPVEQRTYPCLVKWTSSSISEQKFVSEKGNNWRIEIRQIEINRYSKEVNLVLKDNKKLKVTDKIEFAVYGQQLIRQGNFLDYTNTIFQFSDLRHIFLFPNLNPSKFDFPNLSYNQQKPRTIFSRKQDDDLWLGEHALSNDRNLQRAALAGPIQFNSVDLGTTEDHIEAALLNENDINEYKKYKEVKERLKPLEPGEWRKIKEGRNTFYEIYFRRNIYPCTIIGTNKQGELFAFAWRGAYSDQRGLEIESAAKVLTRPEYNITEALLIDEGGDVFQVINGDGFDDNFQLFPTREQVRAMFFFTDYN